MPRMARSRSARRGDHGGVVAAELEQRATEPVGDPRADGAPIRVEPVALSSATPAWSTSRSPTSAAPRTTWLRSGGGAALA